MKSLSVKHMETMKHQPIQDEGESEVSELPPEEKAKVESYYFYLQHGYPQYAGKYATVQIPEGSKIENIEETEQGLQVYFSPVQQASVEESSVTQGQQTGPIQEQDSEQSERVKQSEEFYHRIGYSQYAGKYEAFEIPEGYKVANITEAEGILQIQLLSATSPLPTAEGEPEPDWALEGEMAYHKIFWEQQGHPEYYGKYAPFEIPSGLYVKSMSEVQDKPETPEVESGLMIEYGSHEYDAWVAGSKAYWATMAVTQNMPELAKYGGRYGELQIPTGATGISKVTETSEGLIVDWKMPSSIVGVSTTTSAKTVPTTYVVAPGAHISDVGIPQGPLSPETQAKVQAILQAPAGFVPVNVELIPTRTNLEPGTGREGTLTGTYSVKVDYLEADAAILASALKKYQSEPQTVVQASGSAGTRTDVADVSTALAIRYQDYTPEEKAALEKYLAGDVVRRSVNLGLTVAAPLAPVAAPLLAGAGLGSTVTLATGLAIAGKGAVISFAVAQGLKAYQGGGLLTVEEAGQSLGAGALFAVGGGAVLGRVAQSAPILGSQSLAGSVARVTLSTSVGAGVGGALGAGQAALSGGDVAQGAVAGATAGATLGFAFGVASEVAGYVNRAYVKPAVSQKLSESYAKTLDTGEAGTGELWQPTLKERLLMRLTGATPATPALRQVTSDMITESMKTQYDLNKSIIENKPMPENVAGRTGLEHWTPTAKETEMIRVAGAGVNIATELTAAKESAAGGLRTGKIGASPVAFADEMFDFTFAPRSGIRMDVYTPSQQVSAVVPPSMRILYMTASGGIGFIQPSESAYEYRDVLKSELSQVDVAQARKESLVGMDKGIPENPLAYDYRGPLSYERYPLVMRYEGGKIGWSWSEPYMKPYVSSPTVMKPLWDSIGAKPTSTNVSSVGLETTLESPKTSTEQVAKLPVSGGAETTQVSKQFILTPTVPSTATLTVQQQTENPFLKQTTYPGVIARRYREREEYVLTSVVYPPETPLPSPDRLSEFVRETQIALIQAQPTPVVSPASAEPEPLYKMAPAFPLTPSLFDLQQSTQPPISINQTKTKTTQPPMTVSRLFQNLIPNIANLPITTQGVSPLLIPEMSTSLQPVQAQEQQSTTIQRITEIMEEPNYPPFLLTSVAPPPTMDFPKGLMPTEGRGKGRKGMGKRARKYLWEFPVMEPEKILKKDYMGKR